MAEQPLRERGDEGVGRKLGAPPAPVVGEVVPAGRAGPEAGEVDGDQAERPGGVAEVVGAEVVLLVHGPLPIGSGPVLAQQRALMARLPRVAVREAHPVGGGEQQRRRVPSPEEPGQPLLGRLLAEMGLHRPVGPLAADLFGEWDHQLAGAQRGGRVAGVSRREEVGSSSRDTVACLRGDDGAGVARVLLDRVEVKAADRILHVELVLEGVGDLLGPADEEQVVRDVVGIGRSRSGALAGQELLLGLTGPVGPVADELAVVVLADAGCLAAPVVEQLAERLPDGRVRVVGEDHAPAGLRQAPRVDALLRPEGRLGRAMMPPAQLLQVRRVDHLASGDLRDRLRRHRRQQVGAGGGVDAVEDHGVASHVSAPPSACARPAARQPPKGQYRAL